MRATASLWPRPSSNSHMGLRNAGDPATAVSAFQEAILLYRRLIQERPKELRSREQLGHSLREMGGALRSIPERLADAEQAFRSAIDAFQGATVRGTKEGPQLAFPGRQRIVRWPTCSLIATVRRKPSKSFVAPSTFMMRPPKRFVVFGLYHEEEWAANYLDCANFLASKGRSQDAEEIIRRFNVQIEALISASPGKAVRREWLRVRHDNLANVFRDARRMADAESHYRQALVDYDALVAASGTKPEYQLKRAQCQRDFALMLTWAGRPADAEREYRQAIAFSKSWLPMCRRLASIAFIWPTPVVDWPIC